MASLSFWLPVWAHVEHQPDLGLNEQGEWVVPTGDGSIPAQRRPVLLLPLLHLERDAFEMQLSAKLEALKLPVLPLREPLVLLTLKAGLSSRSDFWERHALKWLRQQDITEEVLDLVLQPQKPWQHPEGSPSGFALPEGVLTYAILRISSETKTPKMLP